MALPPIITNLPFLKLFRAEQATQKPNVPGREAAPADVVDISEAARARFESIASLSVSNLDELQDLLRDTRAALEESSVSLGLQPGFE